MIAAGRRRFRALYTSAAGLAAKATRSVDRAVDRRLRRAYPVLARRARRARAIAVRWGRRGARRVRPVVILLLRGFSLAERRLRLIAAAATRAATRASATITPQRAICATIVACGACLVVSQFIVYRDIEIGQPGYAGLPAATPPTVGAEAAGAAHAYLLVPLGALAATLGALAALRPRRRRLGRVVAVLGLIGVLTIVLVDRSAGLDAGSQATRFAGASAVLEDGFYAELASAAGLVLCGLLLVAAPKAAARYHARRCRTRTNSFARAASALRRRRRRRASSQGRGARRPSRRRSGAESAPASPR